MFETIKKYVIDIISSLTDINSSQLYSKQSFNELGIDSLLIISLTEKLSSKFGRVSKTIFFECHNIDELTQYLIENYPEKSAENFSNENHSNISSEVKNQDFLSINEQIKKTQYTFLASEKKQFSQVITPQSNDVAIIGIAGRYPGANNLEEFWKNICEGKDSITEIPKDRWLFEAYFDQDKKKEGVSHSKWGGFLNDIDKFDPLFFRISPREAELMDPQERIFLEIAWEVFENAGYNPLQHLMKDMAVFVGIMYGQYQLYAAEEMQKGHNIGTNVSYASVANRISYLFDLHGPSMAIDTACSSSLTAIHLACEAIRMGNCTSALAGGVNLSLHPNKYILLSDTKFLSTEGKCRSFGSGGDGYVPGEGVGAVMLKHLSKAIDDKDYIYGVIKGSAINHGGHANGYTVPDPTAQAEVITKAIINSNINPADISYIEAHGTGTSLGDPIEIRGLVKAFEKVEFKQGKCAIGSIKSNIGHCEAAAGISALSKVLLQMKHRILVPTLHCNPLNEEIDFSLLPFYVQSEKAAWLEKDELLAGVSSFGAGGANAHLIVQSYNNSLNQVPPQAAYLLVFSAKTENSLNKYLETFQKWLLNIDPQPSLYEMAYMLSQTRAHFTCRVAIVVEHINQLSNMLEEARVIEKNTTNIFLSKKSSTTDPVLMKAVLEFLLNKLNSVSSVRDYKNNICAIAALYSEGYDIDWNQIYPYNSINKIILPSYQFEKERYWIPQVKSDICIPQSKYAMIDENISTLDSFGFVKTINSDLFYIRDHIVSGLSLLPGVVYLEMAYVALKELSKKRHTISLQNISWLRPLILKNSSVKIEIIISLLNEDSMQFYIKKSESPEHIYAQGTAKLVTKPADTFDINSYKQHADRCIEKLEVYKMFRENNVNYQEGFVVLEHLWVNKNFVLGELCLDEKWSSDSFYLHPCIADGMLQSVFGLVISHGLNEMMPFVPFTLNNFTMYTNVSSKCWVVVIPNQVSPKLIDVNLTLISETGEVIAFAENYIIRHFSNKLMPEAKQILEYVPALLEKPLQVFSKNNFKEICIFTNNDTFFLKIKAYFEQYNIAVFRVGHSLQANDNIENNTFSLRKKSLDDIDNLSNWLNKVMTEGIYIICAWDDIQSQALLMDDAFQNSLQIVFLMRALMNKRNNKAVRLVYFCQKQQPTIQLAMHKMLHGFFISLTQENPKYQGQVFCTDSSLNLSIESLHAEISADSLAPYVEIQNMQRFVRYLKPYDLSDKPVESVTLRKKGVYIITGGMGGLGLIFSRYLAKNYQANLILMGRSDLDEKKRSALMDIEALGGSCCYMKVDISNENDVKRSCLEISKNIGEISGVLHCAGSISPAYLLQKSIEEINYVLSAKIQGTLALLKQTEVQSADFIMLFSSIASVMGSFGLTDYAMANAFLDEIATLTNEYQAKLLTVNWPIWETGGMQNKEEAKSIVSNLFGKSITTTQGINCFETALRKGYSQLIFTTEPQNQIYSPQKSSAIIAKDLAKVDKKNTQQEALSHYLCQAISRILKLPESRIELDVRFDEYGLDSILILNLTQNLEKDFGILPKTLFFEYQSIRELTSYFLEEHFDKLANVLSFKDEKIDIKEDNFEHTISENLSTAKSILISQSIQKDIVDQDIAIVGLSGYYPGSDSLDEFWENLIKGENLVTEIPSDRWSIASFFNPDKAQEHVSHSKWGAFLKNIDKFDPLFFNISPEEAALMDPQERLFLQVAWNAIEDAGYSPTHVGGDYQHNQSTLGRFGVFVGVMYGHYEMYASEALTEGKVIPASSIFASIANRVSYCLNLHGPSLAIDTMCSSSLSALHVACQSIRLGESNVALVGGVNISTHLHKYLLLSSGKVMSTKGRCASFGNEADGLVTGEAVGAIIIKPLSQAIKDKNNIYGLIKTSTVNHGGRTNGYTVPNVNAQAELIKTAFSQANIDPRTISYVEAHGTGTSLGDPIEIRALTKAFQSKTTDIGFCKIGSLKTNIGHTEAAAGIAALTKVLLQMKYKKLVPSLHSQPHSDAIDFSKTPFILQHQYEDWPETYIDGVRVPRRTGISSFGAGGANAHIIIEEIHIEHPRQSYDDFYFPIVISAKTQSALHKIIHAISLWLEKHKSKERLEDISYTLCLGRTHFSERVATVVKSIDELAEFLEHAADKKLDDTLIGDAQLLVKNFLNGKACDWNKFFNTKCAYSISMPGYVFDQRRCWPEDFDRYARRYTKNDNSLKSLFISSEKALDLYKIEWQEKNELQIVSNNKINSILFVCPFESQYVKNFASYLTQLDCQVEFCYLTDNSVKNYDNIINVRDESCFNSFLASRQFEHVVFITDQYAIKHVTLEDAQLFGPITLFRLLKALQTHQKDIVPLKISIFTLNHHQISENDTCECIFSGLEGFVAVLRKEYPYWQVSMIDLDSKEIITSEQFISLLQQFSYKSVIVYRTNLFYTQTLRPYSETQALTSSSFIKQGIYLIIGGAGGIGFALSQYLASKYSATLIWIGRRIVNDTIQQKIQQISILGGKAIYYSCDVTDKQSFEILIQDIYKNGAPLNGVFHSALELKDGNLYEMNEAKFCSGFNSKALTAISLCEVMQNYPLDFMVFFSSIQALDGNIGQANYAAGSTFLDAYVKWMQQFCLFPLKIMNWGFWGSIGRVATEEYRQQMLALGLESIEPVEAMQALETLLRADINQLIAIKSTEIFWETFSITRMQNDEGETLLERIKNRVYREIEA